MKRKFQFVLIAFAVSVAVVTRMVAQDATPSAYGDLLDTEIRGMDAEAIEGYRSGLGLGMALPAELNGYPGPRHVLELAEELELTADQQEQIQALFDTMATDAVPLGEQILFGEAELEQAFRDGVIDDATLQSKLDDLGDLYAQLRFVHLRTHVATEAILTSHQVMMYDQLRGYSEGHSDHHG